MFKFETAIVINFLVLISCICPEKTHKKNDGTIEGQVLIHTTKESVKDIRIRLRGTVDGQSIASLIDITDKQGRFKFTGLSIGNYSLVIEKLDPEKFAVDGINVSEKDSESGFFFHNSEIKLKNEKIKEDILLVPASIITGKVTFDDKKEDKEATPLKAFVSTNNFSFSVPRAKTDEKGCYKIVGLNALKNDGIVVLEMNRDIGESELPLFFGISKMVKKNIKIQIGKTLNIDFIVKKPDVSKVCMEGLITVNGKLPNKDWVKQVSLICPNFEFVELVIVGKFDEEKGCYKFFDIDPGKYLLSVSIFTDLPKSFSKFTLQKQVTIEKSAVLKFDIDLKDENFEKDSSSFDEAFQKAKEKEEEELKRLEEFLKQRNQNQNK